MIFVLMMCILNDDNQIQPEHFREGLCPLLNISWIIFAGQVWSHVVGKFNDRQALGTREITAETQEVPISRVSHI